jgi:hypothetical protein
MTDGWFDAIASQQKLVIAGICIPLFLSFSLSLEEA